MVSLIPAPPSVGIEFVQPGSHVFQPRFEPVVVCRYPVGDSVLHGVTKHGMCTEIIVSFKRHVKERTDIKHAALPHNIKHLCAVSVFAVPQLQRGVKNHRHYINVACVAERLQNSCRPVRVGNVIRNTELRMPHGKQGPIGGRGSHLEFRERQDPVPLL